jgi:hypothetical protein
MRNARESNKIDSTTPVLYLLDPKCLHTGEIRPAAAEIFQRPVMLGRSGLKAKSAEYEISFLILFIVYY